MINDIITAASSVGITAFITNSAERIETQLNRITSIDQLPAMLVSWDIQTELNINRHGFLDNPSSKIVCLLMDKASDTTKVQAEVTAEEMAELYKLFIVALNTLLTQYQTETGPSLSGVGYTLAPMYGAGKHSGVLGRFTMKSAITNCTV